jgi:hypothetical protein
MLLMLSLLSVPHAAVGPSCCWRSRCCRSLSLLMLSLLMLSLLMLSLLMLSLLMLSLLMLSLLHLVEDGEPARNTGHTDMKILISFCINTIG